MSKKIYIILALLALSLSTYWYTYNQHIRAIKKTLIHIDNEKSFIRKELTNDMILANKAKKHIKKNFESNQYKQLKATIHDLLEKITTSDEFIYTINHTTEFYIKRIVTDNIRFKDIHLDPTEYHLAAKVDKLLSESFSPLTAEINQLFNIFYTPTVNSIGYNLLMKKLEHTEKKLEDELLAIKSQKKSLIFAIFIDNQEK